jgi:hypothetical protein
MLTMEEIEKMTETAKADTHLWSDAYTSFTENDIPYRSTAMTHCGKWVVLGEMGEADILAAELMLSW